MHTLESSDLQLVSYAILKGARIVSIDHSDSRRKVFILELAISPDNLKAQFRANPLVFLQDFITAQSRAKKALFSDIY